MADWHYSIHSLKEAEIAEVKRVSGKFTMFKY